MALEHKEALERIEEDYRSDRDNRDDGLSDLKFLAGDQWNPTVKAMREAAGLPVLTVNRMGQFTRQVSGNLRQSYPAIIPVPVDGGTDKNLTDIYAGIVRQIEYRSNGGSCYSWGAECAISCGIGHWKVVTDYRDADSFDQEIMIRRIMDPFAVLWDGNATALDRCDAEHVTETEIMTQAAYKKKWPKQKDRNPSDVPLMPLVGSTLYWRSGDLVRVSTHWFKTPKKKRLGMTEQGQVFDVTKWSHNAKYATGIVRERVVDSYTIHAQSMDGQDWLEDPQEWAGSYFPIIPCIGSEIPLDGTVIRHGIIRWAKDPQRLYNYWRSYAAEMMGMQPKAPWLLTAAMIKGHKQAWQNANRVNHPFLLFNNDPDFPGRKPERMAPPPPAVAFDNEARISDDEMKATTGVYDASLGNRSNETSGVAIENRQQQTDNGAFVYFDNFNISVCRTGTVLVDLIPKVMDSSQVIRILGSDAKEAFVPINQTVQTVTGPQIVNDLSAGKFDVRIKVGPSYVNARAQARDELGKIITADPNLMNVFGDIYFEQQDYAGADKLAERMARVIPANVRGEEDPNEQGQAQAQQAQMQVALDEANAKIRKLEAEATLTSEKAEGQALDNAEREENLKLFGPTPPTHVQDGIKHSRQREDAEEAHARQRQGEMENQFHSSQEAERGRQFSREEREVTTQ